jgi:hypothetical protein
MRGHLRERSPSHWAIVIETRDAQSGKRKRKWHSFKGTKRQAQVKCAELVAAAGKGDYIEPSKATVADFVRMRIDQWEAAGEISARTAERQRQLFKHRLRRTSVPRCCACCGRSTSKHGTAHCALAFPPAPSGTRIGCYQRRFAMQLKTILSAGMFAKSRLRPR